MRSFHDHPAFIAFLAERLAETLDGLAPDERAGATVLFTAHSLPVRAVADGSLRCAACDCDASCRYRDGLERTGDLVAEAVGVADHRIAWQSVGRTADPWWGPGIGEVIPDSPRRDAARWWCAARGSSPTTWRRSTTSTSRRPTRPRAAGIAFARTRMPNADPAFCDVLAAVVRDHLAEVPS